jgi:hypothetical protein
VLLCTASSDLNWRQKLFLSWVAPRGIVSASVASLFAILLTERGISGGDAIKALVFLTIIMTVMVQGLTAGGVARLLRVTNQRDGSGAVIVGCNPLSLMIARLFKEAGESVVLIDTNSEASRLAEVEAVPVLVESALDNNVLENAGLSSATTFLAMTNNGEVNAVIAQQAQQEFQPPRVMAILPEKDAANLSPGKKNTLMQTASSQKVPLPTIALKTWNGYLKEGTVRLGETRLREKGALLQRAHVRALMRDGALIPLVVKRGDRLRVGLVEENWQAGDRIIYLFHDTRPKLLQRLSGGSRPTRLEIETIPLVEDVPTPTRVVEPKRPDNNNGQEMPLPTSTDSDQTLQPMTPPMGRSRPPMTPSPTRGISNPRQQHFFRLKALQGNHYRARS